MRFTWNFFGLNAIKVFGDVGMMWMHFTYGISMNFWKQKTVRDRQNNIPYKDIHIIISETCVYGTLYSKRTLQMWLSQGPWDGLSKWAQCNYDWCLKDRGRNVRERFEDNMLLTLKGENKRLQIKEYKRSLQAGRGQETDNHLESQKKCNPSDTLILALWDFWPTEL